MLVKSYNFDHHSHLYQNTLEELGYNLDTSEFTSLDQLKKVVLESGQIAEAPDNIKNSVENFFSDTDLGLEALPMKNKIENVLYALISNGIISFDRPGSSYPQAAVTGYEKLGSRKFIYTDSQKVFRDNITDYDSRIQDITDSLVENLISSGLGYKYFEEVEINISDIDISKKRKVFGKESDYLKSEILNNQKTPVLINDKGELVEGWHRYNSLLAAGSKTIKAYRPVNTKENIQTSNQDTLKFYDPQFDGQGNVTSVKPAEIIIPLPDYWIKPMLKKFKTNNIVLALEMLNEDIKVRPELYQVKGLRIPNQQLSSNDFFQIKEFKLPTMQNYVIVPSEIVVKVGSDSRIGVRVKLG